MKSKSPGENRLIITLICVAFTVMVAVGCYFLVSIHQKEMHSSVTIGMNEAEKSIRVYLREPKIAFNSIHMTLTDMLDRGESQEAVRQYLKQLSSSFAAKKDGLEGFIDVYGYIRGETISGIDFDFGKNYIPQQRPWYQLAIRSDGAEYTEPYPEIGSGIPLISLAQTLYGKNGEFYGVLALDIEMSWLNAYVDSLQFAQGGYGMIVNQQMYTLFHPQEQYTGVQMQDLGDGFAKLAKMLRANETVSAERIKDVDGTSCVVFFKGLYNGWFVGVVIPQSNFYSIMYSGIIALVICGAILALILSLAVSHFFTISKSQVENGPKSSILPQRDEETKDMPSVRIPLMRRFIIFSVCFFIIILIGGSVTFFLSMREIIRENKGNDLAQMLEIERNKLEASVNTEISLVLKLGGSPLIKSYFTTPGDKELEKSANDELAAYRSAFASNSIFWVNDIDKIFYSDDNAPYRVDPDNPVNYWYNMTLYDTKLYNFNINYNPDINAINLWINVPVFNEKRQALGMVGTGVDISNFIARIYENRSGRVALYFFNADGEITGAKDVNLVKVKANIEEHLGDYGAGVISAAKKLSPENTIALDTPMGKTVVGKVSSLNWYSVAVWPDSAADYDNPLTMFFLVVIAVIAVLFVVFNLFIAGLHKPLKRTMTELERAKNEAVEANRSKTNFLATISHEIRTPLNAIIGISEIQMQRGDLDSGLEEALGKIRHSGQILLSIINDMLDLSKIETGKLELNPAEYDMPSFINDTVSLNIVRIGSKSIEFKLEISETLPVRLFGDELRLKQILNNLLSNAFKYTPKGTVTLSVDSALEGDDVMLCFKVSDTGQGMKPEDLERLFTEYSRFNAEANRATEGTGLGLSITKKMIAMMGGSIHVESEYGKGSVFTVKVVQKQADDCLIGPELARKLRECSYIHNKQNVKLNIVREHMPYGSVLVVDDVETNLYVAKGLMLPYGLKIETAISGFAAIDRIKSGAVYDIVFMDHMMPEMDGIETVQKLRASGYDSPIVALTANAIAGNDVMFKENGFDDFISKPIDIRQLNEVLNRFIRRKHKKTSDSAEIQEIPDVVMSAPESDFEIAGIDVNTGMRNTGGKKENFLKTLGYFCKDVNVKLTEIPQCLEKSDIKLFTTYVHALKSASANIGALKLSQMAKALETAGNSGDEGYIAENTGGFLDELREIRQNVSEFLSKERASYAEGDQDEQAIREKLESLKVALADIDISAIDEIIQSLSSSQAAKISILEEISQNVLLSDYDNAIMIIDEYLKSS